MALIVRTEEALVLIKMSSFGLTIFFCNAWTGAFVSIAEDKPIFDFELMISQSIWVEVRNADKEIRTVSTRRIILNDGKDGMDFGINDIGEDYLRKEDFRLEVDDQSFGSWINEVVVESVQMEGSSIGG